MVAVVALAATATTVAFAASLGVSSGKLTTFTATQAAPTTTTTAAPAAVYSVPDSGNNTVFRYTSTFSLTGTFALNSANNKPRGAATVGTDTLVLDNNNQVYRYGSDGALKATSRTLALGNNTAAGVAVDGDALYVLEDGGTDKIHLFSLAAAFSTGTTLTGTTTTINTTKPGGLGVDSTYVYVADSNKTVVRLTRTSMSTTAVVSKGLRKEGTSTTSIGTPTGLTLIGSSVFVTEAATPGNVYEYATADLGFASPAPSGAVNAVSRKALAANNNEPQGI